MVLQIVPNFAQSTFSIWLRFCCSIWDHRVVQFHTLKPTSASRINTPAAAINTAHSLQAQEGFIPFAQAPLYLFSLRHQPARIPMKSIFPEFIKSGWNVVVLNKRNCNAIECERIELSEQHIYLARFVLTTFICSHFPAHCSVYYPFDDKHQHYRSCTSFMDGRSTATSLSIPLESASW